MVSKGYIDLATLGWRIAIGNFMALYKNGPSLTHTEDKAFDLVHSPGTAAPHPGIYKCTGCGDEIAIAGGHILPPQNHRQHSTSAKISWQLLVYPVQQK